MIRALFIISSVLIIQQVQAYTWEFSGNISVFNHKVFQVDSTGNYSFIVGGHFYGNSSSNSGFPASTLLGGLDRVKAFEPDALFVTGDLFLNTSKDTANYRRALFDKLDCPVFNAVGNHDLDGDHYTTFGPTYYTFSFGLDRFVVLDTEMDNGSIEGAQLDMLTEALKESYGATKGNVFIFSHRPVWANGHDQLDGLVSDNTRSLTGNNFKKTVQPLLKKASESANIYWFAGSMGGAAPASFLYHEEDGMAFIITAIRDTRRDGVIGVSVVDHEVRFSTIALAEQKVKPLEEYDVQHWTKDRGGDDSFNYRLIPYQIKTIVTHRAFWAGILVMTSIMIILRLILIKSGSK